MLTSVNMARRLAGTHESTPTEDQALVVIKRHSDLFPPLSPFGPSPREYQEDEGHRAALVPFPEDGEHLPLPRGAPFPRAPRCRLWSAFVDYNHLSTTFGDRLVQATCTRRSQAAVLLGHCAAGKFGRLRDAFTAFDFAAQRCARRFASPTVLESWERVVWEPVPQSTGRTEEERHWEERQRKDSGYESLSSAAEGSCPTCCMKGICGGAGSSRVQGPLDMERAELRCLMSKMAEEARNSTSTGGVCRRSSSCYSVRLGDGREQTLDMHQDEPEADILAVVGAMEMACEGLRDIDLFLKRCILSTLAAHTVRLQQLQHPSTLPPQEVVQRAELFSSLRTEVESRVASAVSQLDRERLALDKVLDGAAAATASFVPTPAATWMSIGADVMTGALQADVGSADGEKTREADGPEPTSPTPRSKGRWTRLHVGLAVKHALLRPLTCLHIHELDGFVIRRYRSTMTALEGATDARSTRRRESAKARIRDVELSRWGRIGIADTMERKSVVSSVADSDCGGRDRKGKGKMETGLHDMWRRRVMGLGMSDRACRRTRQ